MKQVKYLPVFIYYKIIRMKKYTVFLQYLVLPVFLWSSTLIAQAQVNATPSIVKIPCIFSCG